MLYYAVVGPENPMITNNKNVFIVGGPREIGTMAGKKKGSLSGCL
jgi:hypothetical protein